MSEYSTYDQLPRFQLWEKMVNKRIPLGFDLEITARCNNNCKHCYINLPAGDQDALSTELSLEEIDSIASQAVDLGAIWVLVTGGEPLLRKDFKDIYLLLKRKGLLISIFTNACPITEELITLFKKYPPRDIEVSVYGVTRETYESVTRAPGSFSSFQRGMDLLLKSGLKVNLKTMALRSNLHELPQIADFCHQHSNTPFRFDPLLHLRYDGNDIRNQEIKEERLTPDEIAFLDQSDPKRFQAIQKSCGDEIRSEHHHTNCDHIFMCGAGKSSFSISHDGKYLLCSSLHHPDTIYDLRVSGKIASNSLQYAWEQFTPKVFQIRSNNPVYLERCHGCPLINLCLYCPANAHLECGEMDEWIEYFCVVAHARAEAVINQPSA